MKTGTCPRLVITQPLPHSKQVQFTKLGYACLNLPMLSIRLDPPNIQDILVTLEKVAMIAVVSPSAARWLYLSTQTIRNKYLVWQHFCACHWFCPGSGTATLLRKVFADLYAEVLAHASATKFGVFSHDKIHIHFPHNSANAADMIALMPNIIQRNMLESTVLWLGGRRHQTIGLHDLSKIGMQVIYKDCYTRESLRYSCTKLTSLQCNTTCHDMFHNYWVVSSQGVLAEVDTLWKKCKVQASLIVTSARLEKQAQTLGYTCLVSRSNRVEDIDHLLHKLDHKYPHFSCTPYR